MRTLFFAAAVLATVPAAAQKPLPVDRTLADTMPPGAGVRRTFAFQGRRGETVRFHVEGRENFTPGVEVGRMVGGRFRPFAVDRDTDGDAEASVVYTPPADNRYLVRVWSDDEGAGPYWMRAGRAGAMKLPAVRAVAVGATVQGAVTAGSPVTGERPPARYEQYAFRARAGQRLRLTMRSAALRNEHLVLWVGALHGGDFQELRRGQAQRPDGVLQVDFTAPADGEYAVRASTVQDGAGAFTLTLEAR
jgi:hypothetical protein